MSEIFKLSVPQISAPNPTAAIAYANAVKDQVSPFDGIFKALNTIQAGRESDHQAAFKSRANELLNRGLSVGDAAATLKSEGYEDRDFINAKYYEDLYKNYLDTTKAKDDNTRAWDLNGRQERETQIHEKQEARADDKYHRVDLPKEYRDATDWGRRIAEEDAQREAEAASNEYMHYEALHGGRGSPEKLKELGESLSPAGRRYFYKNHPIATGAWDITPVAIPEATPVYQGVMGSDGSVHHTKNVIDTTSTSGEQNAMGTIGNFITGLDNQGYQTTTDSNGNTIFNKVDIDKVIAEKAKNDKSWFLGIDPNKLADKVRTLGDKFYYHPKLRGKISREAADQMALRAMQSKGFANWFTNGTTDEAAYEQYVDDASQFFERQATANAIKPAYESLKKTGTPGQIQATFTLEAQKIASDATLSPEVKKATLERLQSTFSKQMQAARFNWNILMKYLQEYHDQEAGNAGGGSIVHNAKEANKAQQANSSETNAANAKRLLNVN